LLLKVRFPEECDESRNSDITIGVRDVCQ